MSQTPAGRPHVFNDVLDALRNQLDYARRRGVKLTAWSTSKWNVIYRAESEITAQRKRLDELNAVLRRVYHLAGGGATPAEALNEIKEIVGFITGRLTEPCPGYTYPPHDAPPAAMVCVDCKQRFYAYDSQPPHICRSCRASYQDEGRHG